MNQILVTQKLYVTPGMKRKKKLFKSDSERNREKPKRREQR